ncbi:hypothetical protein [Maribacter luteus]|uniref:Uncharacterized protein n=1 Tax=Maribacter luteus TaxID=2594478 RepID=A0A6I2MJ68_9FLAO|nr:hypothetical protein [Maribacter luteus]MRX62605.1 hypothetical protein [Maribacter luteus]
MIQKRLSKEILEVNLSNGIFSGGHIKEYDENGNLIYWSEFNFGETYTSKLTYDQNNRILREEIDIIV